MVLGNLASRTRNCFPSMVGWVRVWNWRMSFVCSVVGGELREVSHGVACLVR